MSKTWNYFYRKGCFIWRSFICLILFLANTQLSAGSKNDIVTLNYKRINLILTKDHLLSQDEKYIIDSLFAFADRTLQKAESQIGYKTSGDIYFELCFDDLEHQTLLKQTQFWQDHQGIKSDYGIDKTFPLGLYLNFNEIKEDIALYTNYFLLQEFLGGFGLKQRISNSDARHLPKWLILGYCAIQASPWSAYDEDEYSYFEQIGAFEKLQTIPARAQLIYGKYLWSQLLKQGNRNAVSSFWFIVKFTQSIDEAFQFQYHQQFDEWIKEIRKIDNTVKNEDQSDVRWNNELKFQPILDLTNGKGDDLYLICYQPDEFLVKTINTVSQKSKLLFKIQSIDLSNKRKLSQVKIKIDSTQQLLVVEQFLGGLQRMFTYDLRTNSISISANKLNIQQCFHGITYRASQLLPKSNLSIIDLIKNQELVQIGTFKNQTLIVCQEQFIGKTSLKPKQFLLKFHLYNHLTKSIQTLRIDTLDKPSYIKSIAHESENRYSYSDGSNGVWKLRFIEFANQEDLTWHTGVKGSFFYHKLIGNAVWEISYDNKKPVIELFETHTETKQEIISLIKQSLNLENNSVEIVENDSVTTPKLMPFQFLSKFPKRSWEKRLSGNAPMYYRGEFQVHRLQNSYYLKHASLQFTNYENLQLGYYITNKFNQLINSPLTPNLRIELSDIRSRHLMNLHAFSSFTMGRLGLNFDQKIRLPNNLELIQGFHWRSRSLTMSELSYYRNSLFHSDIAIKKTYTKNTNSQVGLSFRSDGWYQKLSSISSVDLLNYRSDIGSAFWEFNQRFQGKTWHPNFQFSGAITSKIASSYHKQLSLWNHEFKLQSNIQLKLIKYLHFNNLIKSIHSIGKYRNEYFLGGTSGWIANNQFITAVPPFKNNTPIALRYWGGNIRGLLIGSATGNSFFVYNGDLLFDIEGIIGSTAEISQFVKKTKIGIFGDAGFAYYFNSPADLRNPHNTLFSSTGNYDLWTSSQRNPWLYSYGFAVHTSILGLPVKYEYAMPFKQNLKQKNTHLISLIWDF